MGDEKARPNYLRPVPVPTVIQLAVEHGIPFECTPAVVLLDVRRDGTAVGWISTTLGALPLEITCAAPWPSGHLDIFGAAVNNVPDVRSRPYLRFDDVVVAVYVASLSLPNGNAAADVRWDRPVPESIVRFRPGKWITKDAAAATSALRWLETLPRHGGGAPEKGKRWDQSAFEEWYSEACEAYADDGSQPTLKDLADALGVRSINTAKKRLERVGLTWEGLTSEGRQVSDSC